MLRTFDKTTGRYIPDTLVKQKAVINERLAAIEAELRTIKLTLATLLKQ